MEELTGKVAFIAALLPEGSAHLAALDVADRAAYAFWAASSTACRGSSRACASAAPATS